MRNGKGGGGDDPKDPTTPGNPEPPKEPDVTINPVPSPGPVQGITFPGYGDEGTFTQNVNQDNDIVSNVTGDNNTVTNTQDNSVNGYNGDAQRFTNDYIRKFTERYS